ncbi:hypothetical protein LCGC14_3095340, partial [marine sediment metagenome]
TYMLRLDAELSETLSRFIERVGVIDSSADSQHGISTRPDTPEEIEP